ncbi:MAG TPA: hypothetical protein VMT51_14995 [Dongiaceae bacterium]|nr:hypothetical protein [Dongiaceae bacterium]
MRDSATSVQKYRKEEPYAGRFATGVSLHSHTMHSREHLDRLPGYIAKVPIASWIIEREVGRLHLYKNRVIDFRRVYWTPPLSAREALELEQRQIERELGLRALVSLTDHDSIEAGLHLRMLEKSAQVPVSVEWSVPFEETVFHIGVHNLPPEQATGWMTELGKFTARPSAKRLRRLLEELHANPAVLIVLNHPYWDAEGIGPETHRGLLKTFLEKHARTMHAVELNGMRSRRENREVMALGKETGLPVISGGDRHGCEPNATLNLTAGMTFEEFADQIRNERRSEILLMPQFFEPLQARILESAWHALSDAPGEFGRRHWMTRVFYEAADGTPKPVSDFMGTRFQKVVDRFRWVMSFLASPQVRPALRVAFLGNEEGGL